jgi:hypothetical protein
MQVRRLSGPCPAEDQLQQKNTPFRLAFQETSIPQTGRREKRSRAVSEKNLGCDRAIERRACRQTTTTAPLAGIFPKKEVGYAFME